MVRWRLVLVLMFAAGAAALAILVHQRGPSAFPFACLFNRWTGLHCPGCGMTRATHALLHGELFTALGFNLLGVIVFPIAIVGLLIELPAWLRGQQPTWKLSFGRYGARTIVVAFLLFFLLRNLPWYPFNLLAPG
ncbi:DUF2752 domain-containing protein [Verrucomicrobiaceae bacterium N1E253]|uniref:DUF2752 domain-containing protein n=1 Tax=Oceaniferula marina TaxID=2748318 RepID=A0A851GFS2_9BACT|nr:DUF2752 domain-containing protein [Oceaniferula marina]NWK54017.1 DUF2752 domain-containing protein [Oceaniferula marina]